MTMPPSDPTPAEATRADRLAVALAEYDVRSYAELPQRYREWVDAGSGCRFSMGLLDRLASTRATAARQAREEAIEGCLAVLRAHTPTVQADSIERRVVSMDVRIEAVNAIRALAAKGA